MRWGLRQWNGYFVCKWGHDEGLFRNGLPKVIWYSPTMSLLLFSWYKQPDKDIWWLSPSSFPNCCCSVLLLDRGPAYAPVFDPSLMHHPLMECSNVGTCQRDIGVCDCPSWLHGRACERSKCIHGCSGHGQCLNMRRLAEVRWRPCLLLKEGKDKNISELSFLSLDTLYNQGGFALGLGLGWDETVLF